MPTRPAQPAHKPADFDDRGWGPHTWAIFSASREGRERDVRKLLAAHPWLARAEYASLEPSHYAVTGGHVGVVKLLLEAGADPNARGWERRLNEDSPLSRAKDRGFTEIIRLLEKPPRAPRPSPSDDGSWTYGDAPSDLEKKMSHAAG